MDGKMTAAWLRGEKEYRIEEVDIPQPSDDQVLVKVEKVGICGSDRGIWAGTHFYNELYKWDEFKPGEHGHESAGTVVEVGKNIKNVKEGDLVSRLRLESFAQYALANEPAPAIGGDPDDVTDEVLPAGLGDEGNQFVFTEDWKWQFNLKTKNYTAAGTYTITMESGDDTEYVIEPKCVAVFVIE